ncbi:hypothetical protein [Flavobacterium restrictum]|nr:hypothetical protein [Flavobacterium restrictum]
MSLENKKHFLIFENSFIAIQIAIAIIIAIDIDIDLLHLQKL